jgi:hypothetical protein
LVEGVLKINLTRATITNRKIVSRRLLPEEVDLFAVYCPDLDKCYYVPATILAETSVLRLRQEVPRNNQSKGVRFLREFTELSFNIGV